MQHAATIIKLVDWRSFIAISLNLNRPSSVLLNPRPPLKEFHSGSRNPPIKTKVSTNYLLLRKSGPVPPVRISRAGENRLKKQWCVTPEFPVGIVQYDKHDQQSDWSCVAIIFCALFDANGLHQLRPLNSKVQTTRTTHYQNFCSKCVGAPSDWRSDRSGNSDDSRSPHLQIPSSGIAFAHVNSVHAPFRAMQSVFLL